MQRRFLDLERRRGDAALRACLDPESKSPLLHVSRGLLALALPYIGQGEVVDARGLARIGRSLDGSQFKEPSEAAARSDARVLLEELSRIGPSADGERSPRDSFWLLRGKLRRLAGSPAEALGDFDRHIRLFPRDAEARAWRGESLWSLDRRSAASQAWRGALRIDSKCAWARAWLAMTRHDASGLRLAAKSAPRNPVFPALHALFTGFGPLSPAMPALSFARAAAAAIGKAADDAPGAAWVHRTYGLVLYLRKDFHGAIGAFSRAIDLDPDSAFNRMLRGDAWFFCGGSKEALRDYERAVRLDPGNAWAHALYGRLQSIHGSRGKMLRALDRAVALSPRSGWIYAWRAEAEVKLGKIRPALRDFSTAARLDPRYARTFSWRGSLLARTGKPGAALRDLDRACRLLPFYDLSHYLRCEALLLLGRPRAALRGMKRAAEITRQRYWDQHFVDFSSPDSGCAATIRLLTSLLESYPDDGFLHSWRGQTYLLLGDDRRAAADFERSLRLRPDDAWTLAWQGKALFALNDDRGAARSLSRAVRRKSANNWAFAWKARVSMRRGDFRASLRDLNRAFSEDARLRPDGVHPRFGEAHAWRGAALLHLGRWAEAATDLAAAALLHPEWKWIYVWLARIRLRQSRFEDAVRALSLGIDRGCDLYALRGEAYRLAGNAAAAREDFQNDLSRHPAWQGSREGLAALDAPERGRPELHELIFAELMSTEEPQNPQLPDAPSSGEIEDRLHRMDREMERSRHDDRLPLLRARLRLLRGDAEGAIADCAAVLDSDVLSVRAMKLRAEACARSGRGEEASRLSSAVEALLRPLQTRS